MIKNSSFSPETSPIASFHRNKSIPNTHDATYLRAIKYSKNAQKWSSSSKIEMSKNLSYARICHFYLLQRSEAASLRLLMNTSAKRELAGQKNDHGQSVKCNSNAIFSDADGKQTGDMLSPTNSMALSLAAHRTPSPIQTAP